MLGILTALVAIVVEPFIPVDIPGKVGADAVGNILNILASSMLAVTTFSLSVMVASFGAATQNVTPRATRLLTEDNTSQTVLSTFVGSFLFSLVGLITLGMGAYGGAGRVVLFAVTLGIIILIVIAILRWVGHLTYFGRVGDTTGRVEEVAQKALTYRANHPGLGGTPLASEKALPKNATAVQPETIGYVEYIDMAALSETAENRGIDIYVVATPGRFIDLHTPLALVTGTVADDADKTEMKRTIRAAISVARERSFDQDPRFGLSVLAEIASRALSPAVNDSGTAIDVIGRVVRLLSNFAVKSAEPESSKVLYPHVFMPCITVDELFEDAFAPIAHDGAAVIQVQVRLQKAFQALSRFGGDFESAATRQSAEAFARANVAMTATSDKERLRQLVE